MSTTVLIFVAIAVIVLACFGIAWWADARRARHIEHDPQRLDEQRLDNDEEQYAEYTTDPRNRMR